MCAIIFVFPFKESLQDHDMMVLSTLQRSHHEALHRTARITMHSTARSVFSRIYRNLAERSTPPIDTSEFDHVLSKLQQTNALLQNTEFGWVEVAVPGSFSGAPNRAPGPNGMAACACTSKIGNAFSFLCLLVDASSVSELALSALFLKLLIVICFQAKSESVSKDSLGVSSSSFPRRSSVSGAHETYISNAASSTSRRVVEGRRRSSSADEFEGKLELLSFCPNSRQQQQRQVLMRNKALKAMCSSDNLAFGIHHDDLETPECSFDFRMEQGFPLAVNADSPTSSSFPSMGHSDHAPLQFYTSPSTLHFGIAVAEGSPARPARSSSPGTHVRMSVLKQMEMAPELEHALLYCYVANMKEHSVDMADASFASEFTQVPDSTFSASDVRGIGLSNERFRVKTTSLRNGEGKVLLQQPMQGELDLSQGVLAVGASHGMRHFGSGSCILTIDGDGSVLVIPPSPRLERLDIAASVHSVEAVRMRERAQAFLIPPSLYLDIDQEGMVTCAASSSDTIKLGVNACCKDDPTQTLAFIVEFGPLNPKLPWGTQFDRLQKRKLEFHDDERIKRGVMHSFGISVLQISCGQSFSIAQMSDGSLWSWGTCSFGSLGHGLSVESLPRPKKIACHSVRFVSVSCGAHHVGARCSNFDLYMWGSNHQGQLGLAREKDSASEKLWPFSKDKELVNLKEWVPAKVNLTILGQGDVGVHQVACGHYHTALLATTGVLM
jgi:hypothetical protein